MSLRASAPTAGINVMIINAQAFNARGKDARRIYEELDDFQTRRPIDVIARNRPILILDEPQKMEGAKTVESLKEFKPLFILRYSATHKQEHNRVYRLDSSRRLQPEAGSRRSRYAASRSRGKPERAPTCICKGSTYSETSHQRRESNWKFAAPPASKPKHASWGKATISTRSLASWTSTKASWSQTSMLSTTRSALRMEWC